MKCIKVTEALSSNSDLISIFIRKCGLKLNAITTLISKQESLEKLYIFESSIEELNKHFFKQVSKLKELFIHSTNSSCTSIIITFDLLAAQKDNPNSSVLLQTNTTLVAQNPTNEQISLSSQLGTKFKICKLCNILSNIKLFDQMADSLSNVVELDISCCNLGEYELQQCNQYKHINKNQIIDNIAKFLSYLTKLVKLKLCHNDFLQEPDAGKIFGYLNVSCLTKLTISHNKINEEVIDDIAKFLSQIPILEELEISCNNLKVTETIKLLNEIRSSSNFIKLNVSDNDLDDKAAHKIAAILFHSTQLKELNLSNNNLQTAGVIKICKEMQKLRGLTKLNISNNNIGDEAAHDISFVFSQNKFLEEIDLSYNNLGSYLTKLNVSGTGITNTAANDIATVLNNNANIQDLNLSHNNLQAAGATIIFEKTLIVNLHKFNISYNNITNDVESLGTFLFKNTKLEEIDVSHNNLQTCNAIKICRPDILKLRKLNISYNNVTIDEEINIGYVLSHNTKLQTLDLSGNNLQDLGCNVYPQNMLNLSILKISHSSVANEVADKLATILFYSTLLHELDLSCNNLSASDVVKIFKGMKNISNLTSFNIGHNTINDEAADELSNIFLNNI